MSGRSALIASACASRKQLRTGPIFALKGPVTLDSGPNSACSVPIPKASGILGRCAPSASRPVPGAENAVPECFQNAMRSSVPKARGTHVKSVPTAVVDRRRKSPQEYVLRSAGDCLRPRRGISQNRYGLLDANATAVGDPAAFFQGRKGSSPQLGSRPVGVDRDTEASCDLSRKTLPSSCWR